MYTAPMLLPDDRRLTLDEYRALEERSAVPHEYRNGYAVALAVPSGAHGTISLNLSIALGPLVRLAGCRAYAGDAKVVTPSGERLVPDFVITCDSRDREALDRSGEATIAHPWLVVEILSPATAADDMTAKLDAYQSIPSVNQYVAIDSRRRAVRAFERTPDGKFASTGPLGALTLPRLDGSTVELDEIYRDTSVPPIEDVPPTA
ncbi:MAG: Uma2 family endonuclease [Vulcanimicrobiaceae bacterium]